MKKRIKLGLDVRILSQPFCGVARYVIALLNSLRRRDLYDLILFTDTPIHPEHLEHIQGLPLISGQRKHWRKELLSKQLSDQKIDVYHATWDKGVPFAVCCPTVMTIHDLFCVSDKNKYLSFFKKLKRRFDLRRETKSSSKIFTISCDTKNDIIKYLNVPEKKIIVTLLDCNRGKIDKVLSSPIDMQRFQAFTGGQDYFISIAGCLTDKRKNVPFLLKSFGRFLRKEQRYSKSLRLLVVGQFQEQSPGYQEILKIVREEQLENNVSFLGYIDDADLYWLLKLSKALIFTSLFEGFGIPILETFYVGTPVITSNLCAMAEIAADDSAILIDPTNEDSLVDAMNKIVSCEGEAQALIEHGALRLNHFDWERTVDMIAETYNQLSS